jgi:uncharacterized membrane protein
MYTVINSCQRSCIRYASMYRHNHKTFCSCIFRPTSIFSKLLSSLLGLFSYLVALNLFGTQRFKAVITKIKTQAIYISKRGTLMNGEILHFDTDKNLGLIKCSGGARYEFSSEDWKSNDTPALGSSVNFVLNENTATQIYRTQDQSTHTTKKSGLAISSLVASILGLVGFGTFVLSIIAVILGHLAVNDIKKSEYNVEGMGFADAGLVLGYLVLFVSFLTVVVFGIVLMS